MTVIEFRLQKIQNFKLAWYVYGHHISDKEMNNFKNNELKTIYQIDGREAICANIVGILLNRGMNEEDLVIFLEQDKTPT